MPQPTIPQDIQGLAYVLLYAQQQQLYPGLTPDQFKVWLRTRIYAIGQAARKGRA